MILLILIPYYENDQLVSTECHVYGQVPEPDKLLSAGLPLFLEIGGSGKAAVPLAMRPFLARRWAAASSKDMCSM
jgi:hypothetical protein